MDAPLIEWFEDVVSGWEEILVRKAEKDIHLQFNGFEVILLPNGSYILNDTTGG